jgi:hypothetical protein
MAVMKVLGVFSICAALFVLQAAAQNVSIDLQNPPNSVPGCHVFSQFAIGEKPFCACIGAGLGCFAMPSFNAHLAGMWLIPEAVKPSYDLTPAGNYSGPLLCSTPGQQSVPGAPPCVVSETPSTCL